MKKKGILVITMALLLTISTLAILSASNYPPILINSNSNNPGTFTKSYTGSGDQLNALLYITNNSDNTPNATNTTENIYIPCPNGWKIIWANLSISNINAPNVTIEPNSNPSINFLEPVFHVMSFQLMSDVYLDNVSVQLRLPSGGDAHFLVYNASDSGGVPVPNSLIKNISSVSIPSGVPIWFDINFGHQFLNTSDTYNNTFFIGIEEADSSRFYWQYVSDDSPPGEGYAYEYISGTWSAVNVDFKLKVNVSASTSPNPESAKPTEIGLIINGSAVSDISKGSGEWISNIATSTSSGYLFYDVDSTWMTTVSFSYIWYVTYGKDAIAATDFDVSFDGDAFWNVMVDATDAFPLTSTGINHINITGIPSDWGDLSSMAYNGSNWIALDSYPPNTISFPAGNGTWIVNCTAPNYVSGIGFEVGGVPVENATIDDALSITVDFDASVSGNVTLEVYDFSDRLNYTDKIAINSVSSTFFIWDVGTTATSDGIYNVTVSFQNGLMVGYNETALEIVPLINTALIVTSFPSDVEYPNTVPITVYYDTGTSGGLSGAFITAFEGPSELTIYNRTDYGNGTYSFILDFGTDFGVHEVNFVASGVRFYESGVSSQVTINYKAAYFIIINPQYSALIALLSNMITEQSQSFMRYLILAAVVGSVAVAGVAINRLRKRREVPFKALASLENIIVDYIPSGITLWAFDFLKMEQDAILVSGFMSAVKSFLAEMKKGGLRKLETEFGTFIREDGDILTATCITSGNTTQEEKWIRQKLRSFLSIAEQRNLDKLLDWKGDVSSFRASFSEILTLLVDLDKAEQLQREKILRTLREKERLQEELNKLGSKLENLNQQFSAGKIGATEFEARKAEIEPKYDKIQMDYIRANILLSKVPYTLEATWEIPDAKEKMEKIRNKFIKITMEIDELQRKEQGGSITSKELKRKEKLQKELMTLIEKMDKRLVK
ncbi:MAG: hypothetical protein ACETWM_09285 [Candidatus Lokiarchaeia archaeon]